MDKKEIAKIIKKDVKTLYNWEKQNPTLYKIVNDYLSEKTKDPQETELLELFQKLNEKEKEYYIADMKLRVLKKELEQ
jgi:sensory box/GGDEF domain/HD domain protein